MLVMLGILSVTPMIYMGKFDPMALLNSTLSSAQTEADSLKDNLPGRLTNVVGGNAYVETVRVYKWRDANGVMQFSNTAPTDAQAEQVMLDPNTNLVQAVTVKVEVEPKPEQAQAKMPKPYSVKSMKKVMDDAKGVEDMLQQRFEEQQKMLNNI